MNYRIGQKIVVLKDGGRSLAEMSKLVQFFLTCHSHTVKSTTTTIKGEKL